MRISLLPLLYIAKRVCKTARGHRTACLLPQPQQMSACGLKVGLRLQGDTWAKCSAARALQYPYLAAHTQLRVPLRSQGPRRAAAQAPQALFGRLFGGNSMATAPNVEDQKEQLLEKLAGLGRGVKASDADKAEVDNLARQLEARNPNEKALASPLLAGKWELLYTTSDSILGTRNPPFLRPSGPIHQFLDPENLKAANKESYPFFNQVYADLTPETDSRVGVQFKQFRIFGLIPVTAPDRAKGKLDTTFLDEELRISRGDRGNLFILRQADPNGRP